LTASRHVAERWCAMPGGTGLTGRGNPKREVVREHPTWSALVCEDTETNRRGAHQHPDRAAVRCQGLAHRRYDARRQARDRGPRADARLGSPNRAHAVKAVCDVLDQTATIFPGSRLRIRFAVRPPPRIGLASPGSPTERSVTTAASSRPERHRNRTLSRYPRSGGLKLG
jgi:hypothetical protein